MRYGNFFAALAALFLAISGAHAQTVIYQTGFENPPFAPGTQLLGQDGWDLNIPPFLNPSTARITDTVANGGSQSVQVRGIDLVTSPNGETDPYAAVGSYRRPVMFDAAQSGLPLVQLRTDVRLDGPPISGEKFFSASLAARSAGDDGYAEIEVASNGTIYGYTSLDGALAFSRPIAFNGWHTLGIDINYGVNEFTFYLDGASLGTYPFDPAFTSDILDRGALVTYALPNNAAAGFLRDNYTARFDNFSIVAVPEPGTIYGLLLAAAISILVLPRSAFLRR